MTSSLKRFAIITVIPETDESVRHIFQLVQADDLRGRLYFRRSLPTDDGADVEVFSTQCRDRSNIPAAVAATELVIDLEPDCVLLVDIAGGVARRVDGVSLGDVLVGSFLQYYEFCKHVEGSIKERVFSMEEPSPGLLTMISRIRSAPEQFPWWDSIVAPRPSPPDGKDANSNPALRTGEIICGDKLLGDPMDRTLETYLNRYDKADAVDMESVGIARALYEMRTRKRVEFLVIRGISDFCNREGNQGTRDAWKKYAAEAAAALAFELVSRAGKLSMPSELLASYREQVEQRRENSPRLYNPLPLRLALQGRNDISTLEGGALYDFLAATRRLLIHAAAGSGKTYAVERLASGCLSANGIPVFISAASSSTRLQSRLVGTPSSDADVVLAEAIVPARMSLLEGMPSGLRRVVIFDGLNEVDKSSAARVLKALDWIVTERSLYSVVVTDRSSHISLSPDWTRAELRRLEPTAIEPQLHELERATGMKVGPEVQQLLLTPFFLDRIMRAKRADLRSPAQALREFLREHGGIDDEVLPKASRAAFAAYERHRSRTFELQPFGSIAGEAVLGSLVKASVIVRDRGGEGHFFHQLQHDYLVSHHLASQPELWTHDTFDAVSFGTPTGVGVSVLTLVVEQLGDPDAGDLFIRGVYDWNWLSAIHCTAEAAAATPKRCTEEMEAAIVALVSEKLFDPVPNTRAKAQNSVRAFRSMSAEKLISSKSLDDLLKRLEDIYSKRPWFAQWRALFGIMNPGADVADQITSNDPVIGWTASNVLRRAPVPDATRDRLCVALEAHRGMTDHNRVVRWRIVHTLGRSSGVRAVETLAASMVGDDYLWVCYGAARSLVEVAVNSPDTSLRETALARLTEAAASLAENVRHEAGEALLHDHPPAGWAELVLPFMKVALDASTDDMDRKRWRERIARFDSG